MKQTLAVDFDQVIHDDLGLDWKGIGVVVGIPMTDTRNALTLLGNQYKIVIHTCRAVHPDGINAVRKFMHKHGIHYDDIVLEKPAAIAYIDDRAVHFTKWSLIVKEFG